MEGEARSAAAEVMEKKKGQKRAGGGEIKKECKEGNVQPVFG